MKRIVHGPISTQSIWKSAIEAYATQEHVEVSLDMATTVQSRYAAILNPYGSTYPEGDLKNFATLDNITEYVKEGGLFVSVADIPCFYAFNKNLGRKLDTITPVFVAAPVYDGVRLQMVRPFTQAPLPKLLGLQIPDLGNGIRANLQDVLGRSVTITCKRVAIVEKNVENCFTSIMLQTDGGEKGVTPLFYARYGEGDFLISLFWINGQPHGQTEKVAMRDAICKVLVDKLKERIGSTPS